MSTDNQHVPLNSRIYYKYNYTTTVPLELIVHYNPNLNNTTYTHY